MAIWGKVFGGVAGFAMGGPFGALIGAALGHAADKGSLLEPPIGGWGDPRFSSRPADPNGAAAFAAAKLAAAMGKKEQLYALSIVMLSAKLAKCDGPVNRAEINAFKTKFQIPSENAREIGRLFDQARHRTDDYVMFATELGRAYSAEPEMLENLLAALFSIARADSPSTGINAQEKNFLTRVHSAFGLSPGAWDRAENGGARPDLNELDAYRELGLSRDATDGEIRTSWRRLVRQYHPDAVSARNATAKELASAAERIARINAAWDRIKRDRRL